MGVPYLLIYHTSSHNSALEWATKYHFDDAGNIDATLAATVADTEADLVSANITFNRWEAYDNNGVKFNEGALTSIIGTRTGEAAPINYCVLVRLVAPGGAKRSSVRYIHGYSENDTTLGQPATGFLTALIAYTVALNSLPGYVDSDGAFVTAHVFRRFSRRRRMRRLAL